MAIKATVPLEANFEVKLPPAPYPGLRPFEKHEWPVFFGREEMADEIIHRLIGQHLVVVHGDSGCGKSSLIRAGVLAQLEQEHARSGVRWRTCAMLPREAPLRNLANELAKLDADKADRDRVRQIRRCLNLGRAAPAALAELLRHGDDDHVCILVDQFEELFSFARKHDRDESQLFVDILVGLQTDPPPGLYAILTMRSEFLGACARFKGLAEAVNQTQYLLPQMERPALLRALREPATLYDGEVTRELAERLIADASGKQDQLPLIQHGLMRLWRRKAGPPTSRHPGLAEAGAPFRQDNVLSDAPVPFRHETGTEEPVARPAHQGDDALASSFSYGRGPAWRLGLGDYPSGGLAALLSDHADEVMAAAAPDSERQKTVEHLFRALIDINAEGSAVRRPQTLAELAAVTEGDQRVLRSMVDCFRADGASFLRPYHDQKKVIEPGTLIDISHEALIRCWRKIKDCWLYREFEDGLIWKSLRIQAQKRDTLSAAATQDRDAWLRTLPSSAWCERYGGGWSDVKRMMDESRQALDKAAAERAAREQEHREAHERIAEEQRQRAEMEQKRATEAEAYAKQADAGRRRFKRVAIAGVLSALLAFCAAVAATWMSWQASRAEAKAQLSESRIRAEQARNQLVDYLPVTAMQLALAGLPENPAGSPRRSWAGQAVRRLLLQAMGAPWSSDRPWVSETAGALVEAMGKQLELKVLRGHQQAVAATTFSPDSQRIVSASFDNEVRVWDAATGEKLLVLGGHREPVNAVAFSSDGNRIVSGSADDTVRVWDTASMEELLVLTGHDQDVLAAAFSPDGARIVSGSLDGTVRVWDAASGAELLVLRGHEQPVTTAGFSPDGTRIVSGADDKKVRVWDAATGEALLVLSGHEGHVLSAAFSPDGARIVSGSADRTVRLWDAVTGSDLLFLPGHQGAVWAAAFSPDGNRIVSGSEDSTVRVWDAATGAELLVLRGHEKGVWAAEFSPDGASIVSGARDGTVRVWDAANPDLQVLRGHSGRVNAAAFSPDGGRIVSGASDDTVRVWDAVTGEELQILSGHQGDVLTAEFSPDGARIVSGSKDESVRIWDVATGEELQFLSGDIGWVNAVGYSPNGDWIVIGSADKTVRVWDAAKEEVLRIAARHEKDVLAAAFSPDGARIVSGSLDGTVRVWDAASGEELLVLSGHEQPVSAAGFSPDGSRIVSGADDNTVRVWDAITGEELLLLDGHEGPIFSATFSPDGARIVSGSADHSVRVWDAANGEELLVLRGHKGDVWAAAFSPDGAWVASGSGDNTVRVSWIGRSKRELIETALARLPRELTDEERRRFYLAVE